MNFLITQGLGSAGDGSNSGLLTTAGLGSAGAPNPPVCYALQVLGYENFGTYIDLLFSSELTVDGPALDPASYVFTGPSTVKATAVELRAPGHILRLHVNDQTTGATYNVALPSLGIVGTNGNVLNAPFSLNFIGVGISVAVQLARSVDERTLDVVFNEAVLEADASDPTKYTISAPALTVTRATRITDFVYRLTTSPQTIGQLYTVTVSGIRDINGSL